MMFFSVFTGSHTVGFLEDTHKMFRTVISDKFTDRDIA